MLARLTIPIREVYAGMYDGPHATPKESDSGPIFLGIKNVKESGQLDFSDVRHISEDEYPRWIKRVEPKYGDIVFSYEATLNRYALIPKGFRGCLGRRMALIRPDESKACGKFLYYYFFGEEWRGVIAQNTLIGSTVDRIPITRFPDFLINVPPIPTQRKIAVILSAYDDLIENNLRRIRILEEMVQNLYREWFVKFRFPGHQHARFIDSSLGRIPEGWEVKKILEFGNVITGKTPSKANPDFYGEDVPFVKTPDMHEKTFILDVGERLSIVGAQSQANKMIPAGSICVSCIGTIGVVSITTETCQTNQQINSVVLEKEQCREFLYHRLKDAKQELENLGSNGATMGNVNKSKFEALEVIAPSDELLSCYHEFTETLFSEMLVLYRQIALLRRTRDLLLPRLISGEVDVSELGIAVPEEAEQ
ncbi:MAG: restriction endonuclease subunit S [Vulcanimicrobiota bacterium]